MAFNLRNRSFLKELDFTHEELKFLLKLSADLKAAKYGGYEKQHLAGKNIALIFEKTSTRTRTALGARRDEKRGGHVPGAGRLAVGHEEWMKDTGAGTAIDATSFFFFVVVFCFFGNVFFFFSSRVVLYF